MPHRTQRGRGNLRESNDVLELTIPWRMMTKGSQTRGKRGHFLGNSESVDHVTVQDRNAPGRQSSHCKFFLSGNAQFSHNKHIEGRMERSRYFVSDGNASPRKGQYDNIRAICKFAQSGCQQTSGFESVFKQHGPVSIRRPSPPFSDKYPSVRPGQECVPPSLP